MHGGLTMPTLQVKDVPEELYTQLTYLAEKDHRSLTQETIILLKESNEAKLGNKKRKEKLREKIRSLEIDGTKLPNQVD
jgi:antitoxin FitA